MPRKRRSESQAEEILDFSSVNAPREATADRRGFERSRYFRTRLRYWIGRGWPEGCARFLARIGSPVYPRSDKDKQTRQIIEKKLAIFKEFVALNISAGASRAAAIREVLDDLAREAKAQGADPFNVFYLGS